MRLLGVLAACLLLTTGCSGVDKDNETTKLHKQIQEMQKKIEQLEGNQQQSQDVSNIEKESSAENSESSSDKESSAENSETFNDKESSSKDSNHEESNSNQMDTNQYSLNELTSEVEKVMSIIKQVSPSADIKQRMNEYFEFERQIKTTEHNIELSEEQLENDYRMGTIDLNIYKRYEISLDRLEDQLDMVEDQLEFIYQMD